MRIQVNGRELHNITADAVAAIVGGNELNPVVFVHGEDLARARTDTPTPFLEPLNRVRLRNHLAKVAKWVSVTVTEEGKFVTKPAKPPNDVVDNVLAEPGWPLPRVNRVVSVPVVDADGDIQTAPGYHEKSHTLYWPPSGLAVPPVPPDISAAEVDAARRILLGEVLADFAFVADADRAHAVAAMLLPFARNLIDGPTPLHLVSAPTMGTGKTLLAWTVSYVAAGSQLGTQTECRSDDEWRKRIGAALSTGPAVVFFDNIKGFLDSGSLAAVITSEMWTDRLLGNNDKIIRYPNEAMWIATANNLNLADEMVRRTVPLRLDANQERPSDREIDKFRHPHQRRWLKGYRSAAIWASLVIVRAWVNAGRPSGKNASMGSFESWSEIMGGILDLVGVPGFLGNIDEFRLEFDAETSGWVVFVQRWYETFGSKPVGAGQLMAVYDKIDGDFLNIDVEQYREERLRATKLGGQLKKRRDAIYGGFKIRFVGTEHGGNRYRLVPITKK